MQRACVEMLRWRGWLVRPAPRDGRKAARGAYSVMKGEPDLVAVKPEGGEWRVLLIECKSPTGRVQPEQAAWQRNFGAPVFIVRSAEQLERLLQSLEQAI